MASTGSDASGSMKVGPPVLDYGTGIQAAFAIAAALYQRTFTGEGQHIDIAMQDAAIMLSSTNVTYLESAGQNTPLTGNHSGSIAAYGCFDTSNGLLMLGAYTGEQVYNTWRVLGDPEHGEKLRTLKTYEMRAHLESDRARMEKIFLTADADEWEQRFNDAKVPAARVRHADETLSHDQLMHRNVVHRTLVDDREIFLPVAAFKYGSDGPTIRSAPPRHGEHTLEVLDQAGFSKENLEQLMADGVIAG
jgi:crotonobetainyl-CoA:carnitine CoA-transferase CaiB-like acyl-CoA transferase